MVVSLSEMDKHDATLDLGYYVAAGTKGKPHILVPEKYHDRIVNLHLKDRTAVVEVKKYVQHCKEALA